MRIRTKVWIEAEDGRVLMSEFRAELLEAVALHGSVAAAARAMRLPNRTAWKKLNEMEAAVGASLLTSESGGAAGGRTQLTDSARDMLDAYSRVSTPVATDVAARFEGERAHFV